MDSLLSNPAYLWIAAGAALAVFEACTSPGLGLFLAGLGAICTGILIEFGVVEPGATVAQFAWFFGLTVVWTVLLWKPLLKFRTSRRNASNFSNMLGETATAGKGGLARGRTGQASWSGTLMNAEIDASATVDSIPEGAAVIIAAVQGTTLKVIPK